MRGGCVRLVARAVILGLGLVLACAMGQQGSFAADDDTDSSLASGDRWETGEASAPPTADEGGDARDTGATTDQEPEPVAEVPGAGTSESDEAAGDGWSVGG